LDDSLLCSQTTLDFLVSYGKSKAIQFIEGDPSMIGNAYMFWPATEIKSMKGVQGYAEMSVSVLNGCYLRANLDLEI
jgi:hypothetical protein